MRRRPLLVASAKHFTSWLGLAPSNKVSGGKMLSSRTRRSGGRAAAFCALLPSPSDARTPRSVPFIGGSRPASAGQGGNRHGPQGRSAFYNACVMEWNTSIRSLVVRDALRTRVVNNLHRRAKAFGFVLQPLEPKSWCRRFLGIVLQRQLSDLGSAERLQRRWPAARRRLPPPEPNTSAALPRAVLSTT